MVNADDVLTSASVVTGAIESTSDPGAWDAQAGDLEWSCRQTLDHIAGALLSYSTHLAMRASTRLTYPRSPHPDAEPTALIVMVDSFAHVLAEVLRAAPGEVRGFHPLGVADPSGFAAMGCDELLIHGYDIAQGLDIEIDPPRDLCERVLHRLFPWARPGGDSWAALLWANGRIALDGHERIAPDWAAFCAPVSEWDGTVGRRDLPRS